MIVENRAPGAKQEWRLVPLEPTEEMCRAARRMAGELVLSMRGYTAYIADPDTKKWPEACEYRVMVSTAPAPPAIDTAALRENLACTLGIILSEFGISAPSDQHDKLRYKMADAALLSVAPIAMTMRGDVPSPCDDEDLAKGLREAISNARMPGSEHRVGQRANEAVIANIVLEITKGSTVLNELVDRHVNATKQVKYAGRTNSNMSDGESPGDQR